MDWQKAPPKAIGFDLGNTLIAFGPKQLELALEATQRTLIDCFGHCDREQLQSLRREQILRPYESGHVENDLPALDRETILRLYDREPEAAHLEAMARTRHRSFLEAVEVSAEVRPLLQRLGKHLRLGLLSNYPSGPAIREALDQHELTGLFEVIVVSGEVGRVKPHPRPFEVLLEGLGLPAGDCVYVGDNWLADVQGARRMGMRAILTTEHTAYASFEPQPGDHPPDARIAHLEELPALLLPEPGIG